MASDQTSDLNLGAGYTLQPGETVGLGHVIFDVAATATEGIVHNTFDTIATNLTTGDLDLIDTTQGPGGPLGLFGGGVAIAPSAPTPTPAPSTLVVSAGSSCWPASGGP